ncbi:hypothetical protein [Mucilaginibacter sp. KACC 22063]|uniref:hypothetical protein n=1 Tax=Mucilaginibacter sp. KACC 22063 TaxID=3025666 RepID=UPI00236629B3|nr:hypothetical protein [Mucilaginibacter sp. KACC 22063]WDF55615.1 hypothetical protein PQ461_00905 [Mucilaginibacter sp. KACC 22063]
MKKSIAILFIALIAAACRFGGRHTVITSNGNGKKVKIEYRGNVAFNKEQTAIVHISPSGYAKYNLDENELIAETDDHGDILYDFNHQGPVKELDEQGKNFLALAVKDMVRNGHYAAGK